MNCIFLFLPAFVLFFFPFPSFYLFNVRYKSMRILTFSGLWGGKRKQTKTACVTADLKDNQSRLAVLVSILPLTDKCIFCVTVLMSDGREYSLSSNPHPVLSVLTLH